MRPSSGRGDGAVGAGPSTVPSDGADRSLGEAAHTDAGCTSFTQGHRPPKRGSPVCGVDVDLRHLHGCSSEIPPFFSMSSRPGMPIERGCLTRNELQFPGFRVNSYCSPVLSDTSIWAGNDASSFALFSLFLKPIAPSCGATSTGRHAPDARDRTDRRLHTNHVRLHHRRRGSPRGRRAPPRHQRR